MSVEVQFRGRLGNNLFQYAFGRIVATELDLAFQCFRESRLSQRLVKRATLEDVVESFPNAPLYLNGRRVRSPTMSFCVGQRGWQGQRISMSTMLSDRTPRRIRLSGYFQRFEYYEPYMQQIRRWFEVRPSSVVGPAVSANDVLINVRGGNDFATEGWCLPASYYLTALANMENVRTVYACGVGDINMILRALSKYKPVVVSGTAIEHFVLFRKFRRIILSNSTFAWWASLLSDADVICGPRSHNPGFYSFTGFRDVDLDMRSPRYREILVNSAAEGAAV